MNTKCIKLFLVMILGVLSFSIQASTEDFKQIKTAELTRKEQDWFIKEFPRSYMTVYQNKTFFITNDDGNPVLLGQKNSKEKDLWLLATAKDEFQDYVVTPKNGYKALLIKYNNKPIGALLYRLLNQEKTIYLAQYFIEPEFQRKGIGEYVLLDVLPALYPDYKRHEILARHQNDAGFMLYNKAGFSVGNVAMVQKYDYDPLGYISFYKNFN